MSQISSTLPLIGTSDDDVIRVQNSVTFVWIPLDDKWSLTFPLDPAGNHWASKRSAASGEITFNGVSPSESIYSAGKLGDSFNFRFTNGTVVSGQNLNFSGTLYWTQFSGAPVINDPINNYTPALVVDASRMVGFSPQYTVLDVKSQPHSFVPDQYEGGRWALQDDPYDVYVSGGGGTDTIYGGQGNETLIGGAGNDLIHVGPGNSQVYGGAGNDTMWGGSGDQLLDGGAGDDTLYVGIGSGYFSGGAGNDVIYGQADNQGDGNQVLEGGVGNDTIFASTGHQTLYGDAGADVLYGGFWSDETLDGGAGNDTLIGGLGHETLTGGAGRDLFILQFSQSNTDGGRWLEVTDFRPGQDMVEYEMPSNLPLDVNIVGENVVADASGDAVLRLGWGAMVLHGVRPLDIAAQPSKYLIDVADMTPYYPEW